MSCSKCLNILLAQCPTAIAIDAGLDADTSYDWEITDKFQTVYTGTATTDADGVLTIDTTNFPSGLLMHFSGAFILRVKKQDQTDYSPFTVDDLEYDCIELLFAQYETV